MSEYSYFLIAVFPILLIVSYFLFKYRRKVMRLEDKLIIVKMRNEAITDTFELLMDHSADFVFRYNKTGVINYVSSNVERTLGYAKSDGEMHFRSLITPNKINDKIATHVKEIFRSGSSVKSPYFIEVYDKQEQTQMLEIFEFPHTSISGEIDYVTCVARNVTSIYKAELELKQSELQQAMILEAIPDALFTMDREARYIDYQVQEEDRLWFKPEQFLGKRVKDVIPEPLGTVFTDAIENAFKTGELQTLEYQFGKPGKESTYEGRFIKLDESQVFVIARDISAQKNLEIELRKAKTAAENATKAKSNFLATMSHEIRTPMNGVIGMTSLLADSNLNEDQREFVDTIQASGDTLLRILNDILDYSKIESGKLSFEEHVFSLEKMIDDAIGLISFEAQKKDLAVNKIIANDIPEFIKTDRGRLRQILLNLLSNAIKFTERGSVTINVSLNKVTTKHAHLEFQIKDTGIGIPQKKLDSLFKEFTQADSSHSRKFGGTGLGLAIVKRLVKLFHGKVSVKSEVGVGSQFSFSARVKLALEVEIQEYLKVGVQNTIAPNKNKICDDYPIKILFAEDNAVNRKLTVIFLERLGFTPKVVSNGLDVIAEIERAAYDVILMDISMPNLDGYEATKIIRKKELIRQPYIIGFSANAFQEDIDKAMEIGMDDYLTKPIRFDELKRKLITAGRRRFPFVS
ncbi:ATP-binding protein [Roseivirga sp.]|uniref:ATP-binding protein n=1 Tax=Roseivirga sp. TaxID=1964215 RepID=UPI003B8D2DCA